MIRKLNIRRFLKLFAATAFAGALIFGYAFYSVATGGAFTEFQNWCRRSQSVEAVVGKFQKAELIPFGSGFEKDKGDAGSAGFNARVTGTTGSVIVDVIMKKQHDEWKIDQVSISGNPLSTK